MTLRIKATDTGPFASIYDINGNALTATGPDSLIVDVNAFLISQINGNGAQLTGSWKVNVNGTVGSFDATHYGMRVTGGPTDRSTVTIGKTGEVFGTPAGLWLEQNGTIINRGLISGNNGIFINNATDATLVNSGVIQGGSFGVQFLVTDHYTLINSGTISATGASIVTSGRASITNSGILVGDVVLSGLSDVFTDFKKVGHVIKSGTVKGVIDLSNGDDHFNGGTNAETVRDGSGDDTYQFGGGSDFFRAARLAGGPIDNDTVGGGKGIDTYDASAATVIVIINLDTVQHDFLGLPSLAYGTELGNDHISGFENAIGGGGDDGLFGTRGANRLDGGGGIDELSGLGGRDILTGGADADSFRFFKLSDSGVKATARDLITDFEVGIDTIDLSAITVGGNPAFTSFIGIAHFDKTPGQLRQSLSDGNTIISGDVNGDGNADFAIALQGHHVLSINDFDLS